jgi:hypothetical protein
VLCSRCRTLADSAKTGSRGSASGRCVRSQARKRCVACRPSMSGICQRARRMSARSWQAGHAP